MLTKMNPFAVHHNIYVRFDDSVRAMTKGIGKVCVLRAEVSIPARNRNLLGLQKGFWVWVYVFVTWIREKA